MGAGSLDQAWRHLQVHLRWIDQPWIGFVFAAGSSDSAELIERTRAVLSLSGQSLRVLRPADPEELRNLTAEILTLQDSRECIWAEGVRLTIENPHHEDPWVEAWSWLLQRLNERRERILRHLRGGLILSMPRILKTEVAALAPDLWSIRALSLDLGPAGASGPLPGEDLSTGLRLDSGETTGDRSPPGTSAPRASSLRLALADEERLQEALHEASGSSDESSRLRSALARAKLAAAEELLRAGHPADAIRRAEEVRDLTASHPEFAARAHVLLARARSGMRDRKAVVADWERAIGLYRKLVKDDPDTFLPDLATSLSNLGIRLSDLGRREEALEAAKEAVEIRRHLAADRPDVFLPDLAGSLNNLAACLFEAKRFDEALPPTLQAVGIMVSMTERWPEAFTGSLQNAVRTLERVIERVEGSAEARETLAKARALLERISGG